ncbi:MAG: hypothetical protein KGI75_15060 [Rhizobiaceae bacterium]|nr:hypothetical protein [Rhizobiaceae bacterium]
MTVKSVLHEIPGGDAVVGWFGRTPRFHDAKLLEINFLNRATGLLRIHAWNMTSEVDADGYFILEKHAVVSLLSMV